MLADWFQLSQYSTRTAKLADQVGYHLSLNRSLDLILLVTSIDVFKPQSAYVIPVLYTCILLYVYYTYIPSDTAYIRGVFPSVSAIFGSGILVASSRSTIAQSPLETA